MPSPTTAITASPGRALTLSMAPVAISAAKARRRLATARSASASGTVKPIELSDEAWKIVDTDSRSASTAAKVRAAMPCTPTMPLPATVTTAWRGSTATAFTGYCGDTSRPATVVPGRVGSRNERTSSVIRVPEIGMRARGCSTLAP